VRRIGLAVVLAVSLALAPFSAEAQQAKRIATVVLLVDDFQTGPLPPNLREAFVQGLRDLGCSAEKLRVAFVPADPLWLVQNRRAAEIGLRHRIAAIWGHVEIAEAGGLMAYAPDIVDLFRQSAGYVKKILDGAKPGDLPLQYPNRWTLVVNLKTAKAIGVTLSPATLARADQIIE